MKKRVVKYFRLLNDRRLRLERRKAISRKHTKFNVSGRRKEQKLRILLRHKQKIVSNRIHSEIDYEDGVTTIKIDDEFGLETIENRRKFFMISSQCVNFNTKVLSLDVEKSTRIWPTAITFLCSLKEWVEMGNRPRDQTPTIASNDSSNTFVNAYLNHCGFYDYVGRNKAKVRNCYDSSEVVCIQREREKTQVEEREKVILDLLHKYTCFSSDDIELFDSIVLTETFLNVLEHGIVNIGQGWWVLAQYHKKHGFISLCIADNGIGIRNTLLVGPQGEYLRKTIGFSSLGEGDLIKLSLTENISGAFDARIESTKRKENRGSRRGNGLKRIVKACQDLNISFSVLSHYGSLLVDGTGKIIENSTHDTRIFGGTMYSYVIPARKEA